jgi:hypothetical protein
LAATWFGFTGRGIWNQSVLPLLIYLLYPQELERVGYVTAAMGGSQVLGSLFTQYCVSPIWKRHELLQFASLTGFLSLGILSDAILFQVDWWWLLGGLVAWGFMWGITDITMPSLFADSLPLREETLYYTRASRLIRSSNTLGPVLVFVLFRFILGDEWTVHNCSIVVAVGLAFCLPMVFLLCCLHELDDEEGLPEEIQVHDISQSDESCGSVDKVEHGGNVTEETEAITALLDSSARSELESQAGGACCSQNKTVPPLIIASYILSGVASGISIRYFPVFFVKEMGLNPTFVQALYMIAPLGQALVKYSSQNMAGCCGASCVAVALQWAFVGILLAMTYSYQQGMSVWIVSAAYLGQTFLMNSSTALTQSILWSTVSEKPAQKSFISEMFQLLFWSVGAAVGGYLVRTKGLLVAFEATAVLQLVASIPIMLLCCMGPSRRQVRAILFPESRFSTDWEYDSSDEGVENFEDSHELILDTSSILSSNEYYDCEVMASRG